MRRLCLAFQTRLAQNSRTPVELRDPTTQYHMMNPAQLKELTPNFSWDDYRRGAGAPTTGDINVAHPEFFHGRQQDADGSAGGRLEDLPALASDYRGRAQPLFKV